MDLMGAAVVLLSIFAAILATPIALFIYTIFSNVYKHYQLRHISSPARTPWTSFFVGDVLHFGPMSPPFHTASHIAKIASATSHHLVRYNV